MRRKRPWLASKQPARKSRKTVLLDTFSIADIRSWRRRSRHVIEFYQYYFSVLESQRRPIIDEPRASLASHTSPFTFRGWVRIVSYKYTLESLSGQGSVLSVPGGRFNIGDIDKMRFPAFPALYIAEDFETSFREKFCLSKDEKQGGLSSLDLALAGKEPITTVYIGGNVESVLDINSNSSLRLLPILSRVSSCTICPKGQLHSGFWSQHWLEISPRFVLFF